MKFQHGHNKIPFVRYTSKSWVGSAEPTPGGLSLLEVAVPFIELSRSGGA